MKTKMFKQLFLVGIYIVGYLLKLRTYIYLRFVWGEKNW
jgi:hypothetical protein